MSAIRYQNSHPMGEKGRFIQTTKTIFQESQEKPGWGRGREREREHKMSGLCRETLWRKGNLAPGLGTRYAR